MVRFMRVAPEIQVNYAMSSRLAHNRNELAMQFLSSGREWMVTIDDDMMFEPTQILTAIEHAESNNIRVMGGLAFGDDGGQIFSTIMVRNPNGGKGYVKAGNWPDNTLQKVDATGTALLIVHRDVIKDIQKFYPNRAPAWWFEEEIDGGQVMGEDVTFCRRAQEVGYDVYVHTGLKTGHVKSRIITEGTWKRQQLFEKFAIIGSEENANQIRELFNYLMIPVAALGANHKGWRGITVTKPKHLPRGWENAAVVDANAIMEAPEDMKMRLLLGAVRATGTIRPADRIRSAMKAVGMK